MRNTLSLFVLTFFCITAFGQKEWSNWYFNGKTLLTFKKGYAQVVHDFVNPVPPELDFTNYYYWGQGNSISYSDPVTGEMKFIIDSRNAYGKDYILFPKSYNTYLRSCPDKFSYHIFPFHDNSNKFYVIQFQDQGADLLQQESNLQVRCPNAIGLGYSIVDLNMNNGIGDFAVMNQPIIGGLNAQITTIRHANGKDEWVIVHPIGTNQFQAILFTDNGIKPAVASTIGPNVPAVFSKVQGVLTASHDGKTLAGFSNAEDGVQLFDFDNTTGKISRYRKLPVKGTEGVSRLQFSPDDSKLYYLNYNGVFQYDFNQSDVAASLTKISGQGYGLLYDMQLAPDGKIYVTKVTSTEDDNYKEYIGIIQCPNLPQYACNFNPKAMDMLTLAFPDLINDFIHDPKAPAITKLDLGKDVSVCFGSYTITAPDGWESYKWNTGETTQSITVTKAGLYYVLAGNTGFSCPSAYGSINVSDKAIKLDLGKDTSLCSKQTYHLHVNDDYTNIVWQNGSTVRDSVITSNNAYVISANDKNGCFTKDTIGVWFKYDPRADFGADTILCNDQPLTLLLYPQTNPFYNATYKWQDGSTEDKLTVNKSGTYWGQVTYNGCTVADTIKVSYATAQSVYLGNDTTLCNGDSLLLRANVDKASYLWNTGEVTNAIYVKKAGTYAVKASTSVCAVTDTINITFKELPKFSLGNDTAICANESLSLSSGIYNADYLWQNGSTAESMDVKSPGLYWLRLSQNGCSFADSVNVTFKPLPPLSLGRDTGFCRGESLTLDIYAPNIATYLWQDGRTKPSYTIDKTGSYFVKVTGNNNCANYDTLSVVVVNPPSFTLGADTVLCETVKLAYNFNLPGASYSWNDGSTKNSFTISAPGTYSLAVNQAGCTASDTINVMYKAMPVINLGRDTSLCAGQSVLLNAANGNATYNWNDNNSQSFYNVTQPGLYFVKVDLDGCENADSIKISYINPPRFTLGNDTMLCKGMTFELAPAAGDHVNYLWQDGSRQPVFVVKDAGVYSLLAKNECGSFYDEIKVTSGLCDLLMPSAFTPNQDGYNDVFRIKYPFPVKRFKMVIYGRWGQKLFESSDINKGWDGKYNNQVVSMDTYVWMISLTDREGKQKSAQGTVMLIK